MIGCGPAAPHKLTYDSPSSSRSCSLCPQWKALHPDSHYRWCSGSSLGGKTFPAPAGSEEEHHVHMLPNNTQPTVTHFVCDIPPFMTLWEEMGICVWENIFRFNVFKYHVLTFKLIIWFNELIVYQCYLIMTDIVIVSVNILNYIFLYFIFSL